MGYYKGGYYSNSNLDYEIEIKKEPKSGGYQEGELDDFELPAYIQAIVDRGVTKLEKFYKEQSSYVLMRVATFDNGEAVYKEVV